MFRCGVAPIRIETGRYGSNRIPEEERVCFNCPTAVENEYQILFLCDIYSEERTTLLDMLHRIMPNFGTLDAEQKLSATCGSQNTNVTKILAKTLHSILNKRKSFLLDVL